MRQSAEKQKSTSLLTHRYTAVSKMKAIYSACLVRISIAEPAMKNDEEGRKKQVYRAMI